MSVAANLALVKQRIDEAARTCGRDPANVALLAVSKTHAPDKLREAIAAGQRSFGENYLQEALPKIAALAEYELDWHFIGQVQGNKTGAIAEHFAWLHSLDQLKHATRLNQQRPAHLPPLNVCIQVNLDHETQKGGISLAELPAFAAQLESLPRLRLRGLMTLPAWSADGSSQSRAFHALRLALETLALPGVDTLSMGMSDDLEIAIAEGANIVRIGTAIFGPRFSLP
jgi:PLP dependent protein